MDETAIKLELLSEMTEETHVNEEIELLYVISGNCNVTTPSGKVKLKKEDVLLVNFGEEHTTSIFGENSLVCKISFSYIDVVKDIKEKFIKLVCNSTVENDSRYTKLKEMMKAIVLAYGKNERQEYGLRGRYYLLLGYLLDNFKQSGSYVGYINKTEENTRMSFIRTYIQDHYNEKALLSKLANQLYLSSSSLSRWYKTVTGESLYAYVLRVRMKKAENLLLYKNISITEIAIECGYGTAASMNKIFRKYYGVAPGEYREAKRAQETNSKKQIDTKRQHLSNVIKNDIGYSRWQNDENLVSIDTQNSTQQPATKIDVITVGAAAVLKNAKMQTQIKFIQDTLAIEFIRLCDVFSNLIDTAPESDNRFAALDDILDFCVEQNFKVFLSLGTSNTDGRKSDEKAFATEKRNALLEQFFYHICERYGDAAVSKWIVEYTIPMDEYDRFGSTAIKQAWLQEYQITKKYIPKGNIAAPGLPLDVDASTLAHALDVLWDTDCLPDVFTCCSGAHWTDKASQELQNASETERFAAQIDSVKRALQNRAFQGKFCITAWDDILDAEKYVQDSCYRGCYLMNSLLNHRNKVDLLGFALASDLASSESGLLHNGNGLLSRDGICKPAWYAVQFIGGLGESKIANGAPYYVSQRKNGDICILCFHGVGLFAKNKDKDVQSEEHLQTFPAEDELRLAIELHNLQNAGEYVISEELVNETHGSILDEWSQLGYDNDLTFEELSYLKKTVVPGKRKTRVCADERKILLYIALARNEMRLITIRKDKDL